MNHRSPRLTVDVIILAEDGRILLIKRKNPPLGWALPGGFVDYGETLEEAARREVLEETGLAVNSVRQMHTYSDPNRDRRGHTVSTVFIGKASGTLRAGDDAADAAFFPAGCFPEDIAFDHRKILEDYLSGRY